MKEKRQPNLTVYFWPCFGKGPQSGFSRRFSSSPNVREGFAATRKFDFPITSSHQGINWNGWLLVSVLPDAVTVTKPLVAPTGTVAVK